MKKEKGNVSFDKKQKETDKIREDVKKGLLPEEKKKHEAVEKALALLASEKIYAYIYADLPTPDMIPGVPTVYQFNTVGCLTDYDAKGNVLPDIVYKNSFFHSALWVGLVDNLIKFNKNAIDNGIDKLSYKDPDTHGKRMSFLMWYVTECYRDNQNKLLELLDNPL
jgi:hypothetical protein